MGKPIPDLSDLRSDKSSYRDCPISPVSDEACIKLNHGFLCQSYYWHYDPRPDGAIEEIFLRQTLALKLIKINGRLRPLGLCLLIKDGYRPLSVQRFVQEVSVIKGLRKEYPELDEDELQRKVRMFAASVNGRDLLISPTPHMTGGAVDLTIAHIATGKQVDMGKSGGLYNTAFPDALETADPKKFGEARKFRRLLFWLALEQGFSVNPTEWWHLSWGDQMWAWATRASHATYGAAEKFQ